MSKMMKHVMAASFVVVLVGGVLPAFAEDIAIIGGRLVTVGPAGTIENGTILIHDGLIEAVGANVEVPEGYRVIDAGGNYVTPGLMNPWTTIGIEGVSLEGATVDRVINGGRFSNNEVDAPFNAAFDVSYAFDPHSPAIPITRLEGITRAGIVGYSDQNIFGGIAAIVDLSGSLDTQIMAGAGMYVTLGANGGGFVGGSRAAAMVYLIRSLEEAARLADQGPGTMPLRERDSIGSEIDTEALIPVVMGEMPMLVEVWRAPDILQVIRLLDRFPNLDIVLVGATEAWMVASELADAEIPVIVDAMDNLPSTQDYGATLANAGRLAKAGVEVAFTAPGYNRVANARLIPQSAGVAVANGMGWDAAMAALTINPARMFGIEDRYGSLEPGKDADVVVWDGDPLEVMSAPTAVLIRGEQFELVSRQTRLRDRYMDLSDDDTPFAYRR